MTGTSTPLPPGWYPDPNGGTNQLYWDGHTWHTAPPPPAKLNQPVESVALRRVRCFSCQHIQQEPVGLEEFVCEKCGQQLKSKHAPKTKAASLPQTATPAGSGDDNGKSAMFSRQRIVGGAVALIVVVAAVWFGWSQWSAHQERVKTERLVEFVKASMQEKFNTDTDLKGYSLNVKDVTLVHKSGNEYAGFATVSSYKLPSDHKVAIEVIDDNSGGMWRAEPGALMFLLQAKTG